MGRGAARVSSWGQGREPYIGQIFAFSSADYTRVLLHTRPIFLGVGGGGRPPLPPRTAPWMWAQV